VAPDRQGAEDRPAAVGLARWDELEELVDLLHVLDGHERRWLDFGLLLDAGIRLGRIEEADAPAWRRRMAYDSYRTFLRLGMTVTADAPFSPDGELAASVRAAALRG
jgi:hypothetical protein